MEENDDAYKILDVHRTATTNEIRRAYHVLCRQWHPDRASTEEDKQRNTVQMFKINEAYEILSDPVKRSEYDARYDNHGQDDDDDDEGQRGGHPGRRPDSDGPRPDSAGPRPDPGRAYRNRGDRYRHHRSHPRPTPGGLGQAYEGPSEPVPVFCAVNGQHGENAAHGQRGENGQFFGSRGQDGTNADNAEHGTDATDVEFVVKTTVNPEGFFEVDILPILGDEEVVNPEADSRRTIPLKVFGGLDWTARGGDGGAGGFGGDGGDGAVGEPGRDANGFTRTPGTDGGPGGRGGNAGKGTDGGHGGRGGNVNISIDRDDVYVLMRVPACNPNIGPELRHKGGKGGTAGQHGVPGSGGAGGRGGAPAYYTTTHRKIDGNGNSYYETITHKVPGGYKGPSGANGWGPSFSLSPGSGGQDGTFSIKVQDTNGEASIYSTRYDLQLQSVSCTHLSEMKARKTYEFGEHVLVTACEVKNIGGMESPKHRTMITFGKLKGVVGASAERLFLPQNTVIGLDGVGVADQGYLSFECPHPTGSAPFDATDFEPIRREGSIQYEAHQLGPENATDDTSKVSDFEERYTRFHHDRTEPVRMEFPIENRVGVRGINSLALQETTLLQFPILNNTLDGLGEESETGRVVFARVYYGDDQEYEIPLDSIQVRNSNGVVVSADPNTDPKGYQSSVAILPSGGEKRVQLSLKLVGTDETVLRACAKAALQVDLHIEKIPLLRPDGTIERRAEHQLVQRRKFELSYEPKFVETASADVVLVTTTTTTADQVEAWRVVFEDRLGMETQTYPLTRYGHLDADETIETLSMQDAFKSKLVVILNDEYVPERNDAQRRTETCRPSKLLNSVFDFDNSTHFLVIGGASSHANHLSPSVTGVNTISRRMQRSSSAIEATDGQETTPVLKANRKTYRKALSDTLQSEREVGFESDRIHPTFERVAVKSRFFFEPSAEVLEKRLAKKANSLRSFLTRNDPLRPYRVEHESTGAMRVSEKKRFRMTTWKVGEVVVYVGPPRFQNAIVHLQENDERRAVAMSTPKTIRSHTMLFSAVNSLPIKNKVSCLVRSLRALGDNETATGSTADHESVCKVVIDCLVGDFLMDVSNYLDGRMKIANAEDRSPTINELHFCTGIDELIADAANDEILRDILVRHLLKLVAGLRCSAASKDLRPWWAPLHRSHAVSQAMLEAVELLQKDWESVLDEEQLMDKVNDIENKVTEHIKKDRKKWNVRRKGRWRAGMTTLHSPRNAAQYPAVGALSPKNARPRKHSEFETGETAKFKPQLTILASPTESLSLRTQNTERLTYSTRVHSTTATERAFFGNDGDSVGGQNPGEVHETTTTTMTQEYRSRPGYGSETGSAVIDQVIELNHAVAVGKTQQDTMTTSSSQNEPHAGRTNQLQEKDRREVDSVGFSTNNVGSEREERGTTLRDNDPHGMVVGMKGENKEGNTEQYEE